VLLFAPRTKAQRAHTQPHNRAHTGWQAGALSAASTPAAARHMRRQQPWPAAAARARTCTLRMYWRLHSGSNTRLPKRSTVRFSISSLPVWCVGVWCVVWVVAVWGSAGRVLVLLDSR
jgi:hypothetical protein